MKDSTFKSICTLLITAIIVVNAYSLIVYFDIGIKREKKEVVTKSVNYSDVLSFEDKIKDSLRYE